MEPLTFVILGLVTVGVWLWLRRRGAARQEEVRLHRICLGDSAQAQRLIDAELARAFADLPLND